LRDSATTGQGSKNREYACVATITNAHTCAAREGRGPRRPFGWTSEEESMCCQCITPNDRERDRFVDAASALRNARSKRLSVGGVAHLPNTCECIPSVCLSIAAALRGDATRAHRGWSQGSWGVRCPRPRLEGVVDKEFATFAASDCEPAQDFLGFKTKPRGLVGQPKFPSACQTPAAAHHASFGALSPVLRYQNNSCN
jgi:hypothetical protein